MNQSGNDILNYHGDPDLGLASSPGAIKDYGVIDSNKITESARDLALISFQANQLYYKQRIADRDKLYGMIDDDKLVPNNVGEYDRARIDDKLKALQDDFYNNPGTIMSDPKRFRDFQKKYAAAKGDIQQAQKRYLAVQTEMEELKKVDNPIDKQKRTDYISKMWNTPFYDQPAPYVPISPFDLNIVQKDPMRSKTSVDGTIDGKPYTTTTETIDPDATFIDYGSHWGQREYNHQFDEFVGTLNKDPQADSRIARVNSRLAEFNRQTGKNISPLVAQKTPGGYQFTEPAYIVAAKIRIAEDPNWTKKDQKFNDKIADFQVGKARVGAEWGRINADLKIAADKLKADKDMLTQKLGGKGSEQFDGAVEYAKGLFGKITGLGQQQTYSNKDKQGQQVIVVPAEKLSALTDSERKFLGSYSYDDVSKTYKWTPIDIGADEGLAIDPKTGLATIVKIKSKRSDGGYIFNEKTYNKDKNISNNFDMKQIVSNKLAEELQISAGKESNAYDTPALKTLYDWNNSPAPQTQEVPSATRADWLSTPGWTDDLINKAVKAGKIKIQ